MESVIERIKRGNFWQFHGGIHPPEQKFLTSTKPIAPVQIPKQLIVPLRQHIGQAGDLIVNVGDKVLKGQALSASNSPMSLPIHAPTSGTITAIKPMAIPHPSGLSEMCLLLTPDGEDTWQQRNNCSDFTLLSKEQILEKIANAGIAGMGGAGFPTQVKAATLAKIEYLIINAAECEPYITADDLLIQEHSTAILDGIKILDHILAPKNILIGIEDNKAQAIATLRKATADISHIQVCVIPTKYPSGGEKQLIKILTGQEVPSGVLPSSLGMVMQNVATCFAIADAVMNDTPLIKRVVTVSGQSLDKPQNIWALIGTPVGDLTSQCGYTNSQDKHLIMGGPMMGFSLPNDQVPVIKTTNCILAPSEIEIASPFSSTSSKEVECIRCGQCADVCPAQLLPQELQWSAKAKDQPQLTKLNLFDCIECGACAYVCPSQIPLVHYYRVAKAEIRQQKLLDIKAEKAKVRFEARKERLEREKIARAEKHKLAAEARKARMNAGTPAAKTEKSAVAAALARVKAKKAQTSTEPSIAKDTIDDINAKQLDIEQISEGKSQVANAIARAKAKKLAQKAQFASVNDADNSNKEEQDSTTATSPTENAVIDKKAKVAAAIAKAKAKKLAQLASASDANAADNSNKEEQYSATAPSPTDDAVIDKKAKVAAAIAKAKAKKLAQLASANDVNDVNNADNSNKEEQESATASSPIDDAVIDKKAKVAAAIAKAKAKKLAQAIANDDLTNVDDIVAPAPDENNILNEEPDPISDKKAKVAAAVAKAKAKAKKAAADAANSPDVENNASPESIEDGIAESKNQVPDNNIIEPEHTLALERKAKIAATVAKAKAKAQAKKLAATSADNTDSTLAPIEAQATDIEITTEVSLAADKKSRIAAAVAKAKAKKLAASYDKPQPSE
ncbi:electron transport complex subunit RsxC [Colwellia sp. Arc7-635]|uniref:electron transport complex subunit RsxC n=1 Tax=Colwellia sp. Arc7-635 TaxID=2497879 RepID=UPI0013DFD485|nr:electron transport complex subunit RsxC [Colwellia sp. Arc7-635]